ncbi:MAG TPA: hypothetical protein VF092_09275 [Longimicrobium sp.]
MSKSIELSDEVYARIEAEASAAGITPAEWIAARLPECCPDANGASAPSDASEPSSGSAAATENGASTPKTLADRMAGYIGRVSSERGDLSSRHRELFLEGLLEKKRTGHL